MKKYLALIFLILPLFLFSQIQWQPNGVLVNCNENIYWDGTSVQLQDLSTVFVWSDSRNGDRGIYAQKVNSEGELLWGDSGIVINNEALDQYYNGMVLTSDNYIIISWIHYNSEYSREIRAQKIDSAGNLIWDEEGVFLCHDEEYGTDMNIVHDSNGGAYVFWNNVSHEFCTPFVKSVHVLSNGDADSDWPVEGLQILPNSNAIKNITADGEGGFIIAWRSAYSGLLINRYNTEGLEVWGEGGILVHADSQSSLSPYYLLSDNSGYFYLIWVESNTEINHLRLQKFDLNGNLLLGDDLQFYSSESYLRAPLLALTSDNKLLVCWGEFESNNEVIKAAKLELDGSAIIDLVNVKMNVFSYNGKMLLPDSSGGIWVSWRQYETYDTLYLQHLNTSLEPSFEIDGIAISENHRDISEAVLFKSSNEKIQLNWLAKGPDHDAIKIQEIDEAGNLLFGESGINITEGYTGYSASPKMILAGDEPLIFWCNYLEYYSSMNHQLSVQKISPDGSLTYPQGGINVLAVADHDLDDYNIAAAEDRYAVISSKYNGDWERVIAQAFDDDGNLLWGEDGIILSNTDTQEVKMDISYTQDNFYTGWSAFTNYANNIYVQRLDLNGNKIWGEDGVDLSSQTGEQFLAEIIGSCFIWEHSPQWPQNNIMIRKLDEEGNSATGWEDSGVILNDPDIISRNAQAIETDHGYLVVWESYFSDSSQLVGQAVSVNGGLLWPEGGLNLSTPSTYNFDFNVFYDEAIYLVWSIMDSNNIFSVYMQKFDDDGNALWIEGGVLLGYGEKPVLTKVNNQILSVWEKTIPEIEQKDIYAQLVDENGDIQWMEGGEAICEAPWSQQKPAILSNEINDIFISWEDDRILNSWHGPWCFTSTFAQKIHLDPLFTPEETLAAIQTTLNQNHPNPFNPSTIISFELNTECTENTEIEIYNVKGQKIKTITCHPELVEGRQNSTTYSTTWHGTDQSGNPVASGIYFYKLNVEDSPIKKMVLLK